MMKKYICKLLGIMLALFAGSNLMANNITISNLSLTGKNTTDHFTLVQFDISWENSWRTSTAESNWDAAWVFVKYRVSGGAWQQAWLNEDGHTAPAGSAINPGLLTPGIAFNATTNPGLGTFIYRSADGAASTFTKTGVQLRWNYGANNVADGDLVEIKVFAIEMVYVPQGEFKVGSGGTESGSFTNGSWASGVTIPLSISSESALTIGQSAGNLWGTSISGDNTIGGAGTLAAAFPKGFGAFYCMKYEISQQQYVDFLNTLTQAQATTRKYNKQIQNYRYEITGSAVGSYATTNPHLACNHLSWMDGAAYCDWTGLRPMTELEYEKACRGMVTPVANECAWGTTIQAGAAYTLINAGEATEGIATNYSIGGNASYENTDGAIDGPLRVGIFAANGANTGRVTAGASYYGIMEMSGNLWERPVTVGNPEGRAFTGLHGNGGLSAAGHANVTAWPGLISNEVTDATGSGFRGGDWTTTLLNLRTSDRVRAARTVYVRYNHCGFRGVRTQPPFTCGISTITKSHLASGGVAPVDKTVTYETVSTTLFDGTKCAIIQNLGATNKASSETDNTEASAGWYWQFNRKQGYKHDGTTRTPNTTWITSISETSDWVSANDPCTIELGTGWRIPTNTEWTSADANGSWGNYNDTYASVLKLHAAGHLSNGGGSLGSRGSNGYYRSGTQYGATTGWSLYFFSGGSDMTYINKAYGFSVRCIKDLLPTLTTTAVTSITSDTATSGGNVTDDGGSDITARGVCWSTATGPTVELTTKTSDGTGSGTFTSAITGLAGNTLYYVRAYATNSAGTAYGNEVSFTTAAFVCGTSTITKSHLASSGVAPVDKTVTYETVSTTLFGGTKCAITQNLGASDKASSATDTDEASAGWYWQFNRKQGYKVADDGTTRTPSTTWDATNDNLSATWEAAKDPCTLELGTGWRIPTNIEWFVAIQSGSWNNYDNTYASVLKLHATGYLLNSNGLLIARGLAGIYWSSTQYDVTISSILYFDNRSSYTAGNLKSFGYSVRCVRDLSPTLTTTAVTSITSSTATSGGNVTDDGGSTITARGICWSTTTGPTADLTTHTPETGTTGEFSSNLTGLNASTLYYVRAYATNSAGTAYGDEVSFTTEAFVCGTSTISDIENNTYNTVLIGSQCWMKENLKVTKNPAGTDITRYCYKDSTAYCDTYGGLYTWAVMMNGSASSSTNPSGVQGICPTGWHIPGDAEWTQLTDFLGGESGAGAKMKETGTTHWSSPNEGATNTSGFTGLPGGCRYTDGSFNFIGGDGYFWSSSELSATYAWYRYLDYYYANVDRGSYTEGLGFSVRCVRD
jgi:uncharacterized protein (TIGR02145 family)